LKALIVVLDSHPCTVCAAGFDNADVVERA